MTASSRRGVIDGRVAGTEEMLLPVFDPAVRNGLGVFETVLVRAGRPFLIGRHARRMATGLGLIGATCPPQPGTLARWGMLAVEVGAVREGVLRMLATSRCGSVGCAPGEAGGFFARVEEGLPYGDELLAGGLRVAIGCAPRTAGSLLAGVKAISYADHLLARLEARERGCDESLLQAPDGSILEGASSNLFLVEGDRLVTPPLTTGILPGVTRGLIADLAGGHSLGFVEERIDDVRLYACDEGFLTSSLMGVAGIVEVDGVRIGSGSPGPFTRALRTSWLRLTGGE